MSETARRHRGVRRKRLTAPETRFLVAVVTLAVLLTIALARHLVSVVTS